MNFTADSNGRQGRAGQKLDAAIAESNRSEDIVIDPEFKALIPPLTDGELQRLEASLIAEGCRDSLVVWKGHDVLLDGHHRRELCEKHGIKYSVVAIDLPNRNAAKAWTIHNQFGRRNLTPYQRAELALQLEPLIAKRAKKNQVAAGRRNGKGCQKSDKAIEPVDTKKEIAKVAGVSHDTIAKAKIIDAKADDATKEKLRRGETTIHHEYKRITQAEKKAEQIEAVETAELPAGKFHVIVADPPWMYGKRSDDVTHRGRCPYPSMSTDEIKALDVAGLAHDNCILWLWTTNAHMVEAHQVAAHWGFTVKTIRTWAKPVMGVGDWLRGQTEHCLFCVRGKPVVNLTNQTTLLHGAAREHSRKPVEFYEDVEAMCPGKKVELFAREQRSEWELHGTEKGKFAPAEVPAA